MHGGYTVRKVIVMSQLQIWPGIVGNNRLMLPEFIWSFDRSPEKGVNNTLLCSKLKKTKKIAMLYTHKYGTRESYLSCVII